MTLPEALRRVERRLVLRALTRAQGHRREAARSLGVSERNLYERIERLDLAADLADLGARHGWPVRGGEGLHHDRAAR